MEYEAFHYSVDIPAIAVESQADQIEGIRSDGSDRAAIVLVVVCVKQSLRKDRRSQATLECSPQSCTESLLRSAENHDGLTDQLAVRAAGRINVAFSCKLRVGSDKPPGQETGDIQFLPNREIISNDNCNLGIEVAHGLDFAQSVIIKS